MCKKESIQPLTVSHFVKWSKGHASMAGSRLKSRINCVWMDSRKISEGDVFIALKSEKDDGHKYVIPALRSGAVTAVVSRKMVNEYPKNIQKKIIAVRDPQTALQMIASQYRKHLNIKIIAVTGSSGKTTTCKYICSILSECLNVGKTKGNWNNHIGVPLSILRLTGKEDVAVIELGANHKNEIKKLSQIVKPDIGVITNIGYAHIGYFKTLDITAEVKLEIVNGMNKRNGYLLLNGDDKRLINTSRKYGYKNKLFGFSSKCDLQAKNINIRSGNVTNFKINDYEFSIPMPGRHFVYNALPAIYLAYEYGLSNKDIKMVLQSVKADSMRGEIIKKSSIKFIVDCYNANPSSMKAGITLLEDIAGKGRKCAIVGDMLELGIHAKRLHRQLGKNLAEANVKKIIAVGDYAQFIADGAVKYGKRVSDICCAADREAALICAKKNIKSGDTVLLKASRALKLEYVFEKFDK